MSLEQLRRAIHAPVTSVHQWAVLVVLGDSANETGGQCFPSQSRIARLTHLSERHVRRVLADLIASGLVRVVTPYSGTTSARYQLNLPRTDRPDGESSPDQQTGQERTLDRTGVPVDRTTSPAIPPNPSETLRGAGAHARDARAAQTGNGTGPDDRSWLPPPSTPEQLSEFRQRLDAEREQRQARALAASQTADPAPETGEVISAVRPLAP